MRDATKFIQFNYSRRRVSLLACWRSVELTTSKFAIFPNFWEVLAAQREGPRSCLLHLQSAQLTCITFVTRLSCNINNWPTFTTYLFPLRSCSPLLLTNLEVENRLHMWLSVPQPATKLSILTVYRPIQNIMWRVRWENGVAIGNSHLSLTNTKL